jgi:hypothetical protein
LQKSTHLFDFTAAAARFALALEVSTDELLGLAGTNATPGKKPRQKILRRMEQIERLPAAQQTPPIETIDTFSKAASK